MFSCSKQQLKQINKIKKSEPWLWQQPNAGRTLLPSQARTAAPASSCRARSYEAPPCDIFFLLQRHASRPKPPISSPPPEHQPALPAVGMIKGQACHLVSRPSLKGWQRRDRGRWGWEVWGVGGWWGGWWRKTPWHTGLMKAMNHSLVFKEHISGVINSAQRPRPGWTDRSLYHGACWPRPLPPATTTLPFTSTRTRHSHKSQPWWQQPWWI